MNETSLSQKSIPDVNETVTHFKAISLIILRKSTQSSQLIENEFANTATLGRRLFFLEQKYSQSEEPLYTMGEKYKKVGEVIRKGLVNPFFFHFLSLSVHRIYKKKKTVNFVLLDAGTTLKGVYRAIYGSTPSSNWTWESTYMKL